MESMVGVIQIFSVVSHCGHQGNKVNPPSENVCGTRRSFRSQYLCTYKMSRTESPNGFQDFSAYDSKGKDERWWVIQALFFMLVRPITSATTVWNAGRRGTERRIPHLLLLLFSSTYDFQQELLRHGEDVVVLVLKWLCEKLPNDWSICTTNMKMNNNNPSWKIFQPLIFKPPTTNARDYGFLW